MSELTYEYLHEHYEIQDKSLSQIAKENGFAHANVISRALKKVGIAVKSKSETQKNAIKEGRANHPTEGKKRDKQTILKISKANSENQKEQTAEQKSKKSKDAKERWANLSDAERTALIQARTKGIQKAAKEGSGTEKIVVECLQQAGFYIEKHRKGLILNDKLEVDIYLPELATVIEIDGPAHFLPIYGYEKLQKHVAADTRKSGLLINNGFRIIRVRLMKKTISRVDEETIKDKLLEICNSIKERLTPNTYFEVDVR